MVHTAYFVAPDSLLTLGRSPPCPLTAFSPSSGQLCLGRVRSLAGEKAPECLTWSQEHHHFHCLAPISCFTSDNSTSHSVCDTPREYHPLCWIQGLSVSEASLWELPDQYAFSCSAALASLPWAWNSSRSPKALLPRHLSRSSQSSPPQRSRNSLVFMPPILSRSDL